MNAIYVDGATQATVKRNLAGIKAKYASAGRGRVWVWVDQADTDDAITRLRRITLKRLVVDRGEGPETLEDRPQYERLTRLGRNLRPGDEILVSENLGDYRSGRVRVSRVVKGGRAYFSGRQQWTIFHGGPVAGDLRAHLWTGDYWGRMTCDADDSYEILRPIGA